MAGAARGWVLARGLGMATFAIPFCRRHPACCQMAFFSTLTRTVVEWQQEVSGLWITPTATELALVAALWSVVIV